MRDEREPKKKIYEEQAKVGLSQEEKEFAKLNALIYALKVSAITLRIKQSAPDKFGKMNEMEMIVYALNELADEVK